MFLAIDNEISSIVKLCIIRVNSTTFTYLSYMKLGVTTITENIKLLVLLTAPVD